jgi:hypothetical protein
MLNKVLSSVLTIAIIVGFAGMGNAIINNGHGSSEISDAYKKTELLEKPEQLPAKIDIPEKSGVYESNSTGGQSTSQRDSTKEANTEVKMISMNITVGSKIFNATLEDNDTTRAFIKKLPLTLNMDELNGNEKYNYLEGNLRANTASSPGTIKEGEIMLYGSNCLVLFYKSFNTSYSYVKLGHINNTTGFVEALGSGSVGVTFSVSK